MQLPRQLLTDCCSESGLRRTRRLLSLLTGSWSNMIIGLALSSPVYSGAVKITFGIWQLQVGVVTSAFLMGSGLAFIPGFCLDSLGPKLTNMIGLFLFAIGSSLSSLLVYLQTYHIGNFGQLAFFFFIAGLGSSYFYVANTTVNVLNYSSHHRGQVMALLDIFYSASALFYAPVYYGWFSAGSSRPPDLWGFMLFVSTFGVLAGVANVFGCSRVPLSSDSAVAAVAKKKQEHSLKFDDSVEWSEFFQLVKSRRYQQLLWTFALTGAAASLLLGNSNVIARAVNVTDKGVKLVLWPSLFSVFAHAVIAPVSDSIAAPYGRSGLWLLSNASLLIGILLPAVVGDATNYQLLIVANCLAQLGQTGQIFFCLILAERYPRWHLGKLTGLGMFVQSSVALLLQSLFGCLFDLESFRTEPATDRNCSGAACFSYSLAFAAALVFAACAANVAVVAGDATDAEEE